MGRRGRGGGGGVSSDVIYELSLRISRTSSSDIGMNLPRRVVTFNTVCVRPLVP